ncbi:MAG: pectin methylesterase [Lachnospiraceae bacterium]|nr:pectin methylesterase [Lachnospiraceae bacterium]
MIKGQTHIDGEGLTIKGETYEGNISARAIHADGRPVHTFRSYTVLADGRDLFFEDCTFINSAGPGKDAGQAVALYLDGDGIRLKGCKLIGHQDTLFLAPLPEKEYEKDGFVGPGQFKERTPRVFYFEDCIIEGGVDFIFGGAEAYFKNCEFKSVEEGYVFAPSTPEGQKEGFVCEDCRFTAAEGIADGSCYIARPWRDHAAVRLENCYLGAHINPAGFHDWGKERARSTVRFVEKGSYGPGAEGKRAPFVKVIG